eukprot:Hpha_TRINITY_DN11429_c0_g2::TRINITY_DN11429_c0_g2_i1::g.137355::m.137355
MVFACKVATDLYGRKCNTMFELDDTPNMETLHNVVESHYDVAARSTRPAGYPHIPFKVHTFQLFDQVLLSWVELYSSAQLFHCAQLYAFQPENPWHSDVQGKLEAAVPIINWMSMIGLPRRSRAGQTEHDRGQPPTMKQKLESVFEDLDIGGKKYIIQKDLLWMLETLGVKVVGRKLNAQFMKHNRVRSGKLSFEEWCAFGRDNPNIIDVIFFKKRPVWNDDTAREAAQSELLAMRKQRERELQQVAQRRDAWLQRSALERQLEGQRRTAELSRLTAEIATLKEHAALDKLNETCQELRRDRGGDL